MRECNQNFGYYKTDVDKTDAQDRQATSAWEISKQRKRYGMEKILLIDN